MNREEIKLMIKDCVYSEDGITYMSDKQYNNYIDMIEQLQKENQKLKEHIEKYERYCKTTGIEELMQNKKYKEVFEKAITYINDNLIISSILDGKKYYTINDYSFDYKELLDILKEDE